MRRISIAVAVLAMLAITAHADVYKSVDAQGQVRYSDQWSPGAELIKGDRTRSLPGPADSSAPVATDRAPTPDTSKSAAAKVQADVAASRAEQCTQLKEQYAKVIRARRIYQPSTDSSAPKQFMTDAEADAERVKVRQAMDDACAPSDSSS